MNALVGLNFLTKDPQGHYALTPESAAFRSALGQVSRVA